MTVQHHVRQEGVLETRTYASPLMAPDDMLLLNDAMPNGAQQYFDWVKGQTSHRQRLETSDLESHIVTERIGQFCALAVSLVFGFFAFWIGTHGGNPFLAGAFVGSPVAGIVIAFITGRITGKSENVEKTRILAGQPTDEEQQAQGGTSRR